MGEVVHRSRIRIVIEKGPTRKAGELAAQSVIGCIDIKDRLIIADTVSDAGA